MFGHWLLLASAAAGLLVSIYDYLWAIGVSHTSGVVLVIVSTALVAGASAFIAFQSGSPRWLIATLEVLILLGLIGTGAAAYFLEAHVLLGLMVLGFLGWLVAIVAPTESRPATLHNEYQGAVR